MRGTGSSGPSWQPSVARRLRSRSTLLDSTSGARVGAHLDPRGVVGWHGGMQAQDYASGLWSVGIRIPGSTQESIVAALDNAAILRTWPMRGTIHLIDSRDAQWLLRTTGARSLRGLGSRWKALGIDARQVELAAEVLRVALSGQRTRTRSQLAQALTEAGLNPTGQRLYHLLFHAAASAIICLGPNLNGEQTFRLLADWAPEQRALSDDEAWIELAWRYFRSHGPASLKDFTGWAGITVGQARSGIAGLGDRLTQGTVHDSPAWVATEVLDAPLPAQSLGPGNPVWALPSFDEYVLGVKDRSLLASPAGLDALVPGKNGVFRATIMHGGRLHAIWTKTNRNDKVVVDLHWLAEADRTVREHAPTALRAYAKFFGRELLIREHL